MFTVSIDISRNWDDDKIPAQLVLRSRSEMSAKKALCCFRRSVSQWLANTKEGKSAWEWSHHNFNYGDLLEEGFGTVIPFLQANGLDSAEIVRLDVADCDESWDSTFIPEGA